MAMAMAIVKYRPIGCKYGAEQEQAHAHAQERLQEALATSEVELETLQTETAGLRTKLDDCRDRIRASTAHHHQAQTALRAKLEAQIDALVDRGAAREDEHRRHEAQRASEQAALEATHARHQTMMQILRIQTSEDALELQRRLQEQRSELEALRLQLQTATATATTPTTATPTAAVEQPTTTTSPSVAVSLGPEPTESNDDGNDNNDGWGDDW